MKLNEHIYWQNKTRFDLEEDRYETWTLFAVEEGSFRFEIVLPDSAESSRSESRRSHALSSASSHSGTLLPEAPKQDEAHAAALAPENAAPCFPEEQARSTDYVSENALAFAPAAEESPAFASAAASPSGPANRPAASAQPPFTLPLAGEAGFGSAVLCPPGGVLRRETVTPLTFHYVQFECSEEQVEGAPCPWPWVSGLLTFEDVRRLRSNYAHLRRAESDASPAGRAWTLHLALDLLRLHETEQRREFRPEARFTEDALMARAAAEIEARFGAPLPLEALAAELGLSPVQFTRRFRAAFGETPSRFLKSLRLARARRLLGDTELTLAEIAERCGYENGFYLSRVFTAETGLPPSEYRRRRRV